MQPIVIYGAGGHGREVAFLLDAVNRASRPRLKLRGWIDDDESLHGKSVMGFPVLGGMSWVQNQGYEGAVAIGIADPVIKKRVIDRLRGLGLSYPVLKHPQVDLHPSNKAGLGVQLTSGSNLTVNVELGDFVILNRNATLGHENCVGKYSTIHPSATISGEITLGEGVFVGAGATLINRIRVGDWARIGAGALVRSDVAAGSTVVGVPARPLSRAPPRSGQRSGRASR